MDDETKLTLHGLQQHYVKLQESEKNRKLFDLLDLLEFNQVRKLFEVFDSKPSILVSHIGCNLCQDSAALCSSQSTAGGTEFSFHLHS